MYGRVSGRQPTYLPAGLPGPTCVHPEAGNALWMLSKLCSARPICLRLFWQLARPSRFASTLHGRQQEPDQDRDNRDHDEQFDQREPAADVHGRLL